MEETILSSVDYGLLNTYIDTLDPLNGEYTVAHNPVIPVILNKVFGYTPEYRLYYDNEKLEGFITGVYFRKKYISLPHFSYGGAATDDSKKAEIIQNGIGGKYEIRSLYNSGEYAVEEKVTSYLDLAPGEDEVYSSFKYNIRRQIRIGGENGVVIKRGGIELLDDFQEVYYTNMRRLGSPPQPRAFFETFISDWANGEATIFCAYINDKPIGSAFLLSYGKIIENCWAGTLTEYNKLYVPYLLYWEMIKYSVGKGYKAFSFGRSSKGSGSLKFKNHWKPIIKQIYFIYSERPKGNIKNNHGLINIYKKITTKKLNIFIGRLITRHVY